MQHTAVCSQGEEVMLRTLKAVLIALALVAAMPAALFTAAATEVVVSSSVMTYKVKLSNDRATNRTVYVLAKTSSEASQIARDQNEGWRVELVSEIK
jgi:hypothetical protein